MKNNGKTRVTAEELLSRLQSDPAWVAKRQEEERVRAERASHLRAAEAPLIAELADRGLQVESVWDLVNTAGSYSAAIPVLLDHLRKPYPDKVAEGIARALAVAEAYPYWQALVDEYEATDVSAMPGKKDGLACAVAKTARNISEVVRIIRNPLHGESRLLLLPALRQSHDPVAALALQELAGDPVFKKEIASWRHLKR